MQSSDRWPQDSLESRFELVDRQGFPDLSM